MSVCLEFILIYSSYSTRKDVRAVNILHGVETNAIEERLKKKEGGIVVGER